MIERLINQICLWIAVPAEAIGTVVQPLLELLPGDALAAVIAAVIFGIVWFGLTFSNMPFSMRTDFVGTEFKLQMTWLWAAFLIGYLSALSGKDNSGSFLGSYAGESKMTFFTVPQWAEFPKIALILMVFGLIFCAVVYGIFIRGGIMTVVRVYSGFPFFMAMGYALMAMRENVLEMLVGATGLLRMVAYLLLAATGLIDAILCGALFLLLVVFILPDDTIEELNEMREKKERRRLAQLRSHRKSADSAVPAKAAPPQDDRFPVYAADDKGNKYPVEMRGDFLYIRMSTGEVSTKWEYISDRREGGYVFIQGHRFHLHY